MEGQNSVLAAQVSKCECIGSRPGPTHPPSSLLCGHIPVPLSSLRFLQCCSQGHQENAPQPAPPTHLTPLHTHTAATHYGDDERYEVDPLKGNVAFAAALYGWSFTLQSFASLYVDVSAGRRRAAVPSALQRCLHPRLTAFPVRVTPLLIPCSCLLILLWVFYGCFCCPLPSLQVQGVTMDPKEFAQRLWGDRYFNPGGAGGRLQLGSTHAQGLSMCSCRVRGALLCRTHAGHARQEAACPFTI